MLIGSKLPPNRIERTYFHTGRAAFSFFPSCRTQMASVLVLHGRLSTFDTALRIHTPRRRVHPNGPARCLQRKKRGGAGADTERAT